MQAMRVAAVSMNGLPGEPSRVLGAIDGWCERAAAAKADLVLFPELVVHGHCTPNTWELAEPVPEGPSTRALSELARRHRLVLSSGLSEKKRDIVYNTQVLAGPDGYIGKQRKLHLSRDEVNYYKGVREEMIVADLDPMPLARGRSPANYMLRTRRPELFGELTRDQVSC
jgi:predicted amidohydrolase